MDKDDKGLIFDCYISAETEVDLLKMESVLQYMSAAIAHVNRSDIDKKDRVVKALNYSLDYIKRCQATFKYDQSLLRDLERERNKLKLETERLAGENAGLKIAIEKIKTWS